MVRAGEIAGIEATLKNYRGVRVADYQRNFDWSKSEITEFWDDLNNVLVNDKDHFFGTLILQQIEDQSCELVDGQQRMTTVFLFVARLRDAVKTLSISELKAKTSNERDIPVLGPIEDFLYGPGSETKPRFSPNTLLKDVGAAALGFSEDAEREKKVPRRSSEPDRLATLPFRNAYWLIKMLITKDLDKFEDEEEKLRRIHELSRALLHRMKVLTITTDNSEESLDVFMTINDRGLPLGVFDLTRGQVLKAKAAGKSDKEQKDIFVETLKEWGEILENVAGSKPDQFLRHHLLSTIDKKITMKSVPSVTDEEIGFSKSGSSERASQLWEKIRVSSEVYGKVLRPSLPKPAKEQLEGMRLIADSYRVLALRIMHPEAELSESQQTELVRLLWICVLRWSMAGLNAQDFETKLQKIAVHLWVPGGFTSAKKDLKDTAHNTEYDLEKYLEEPTAISVSRTLLLAIETELRGKANAIDLVNLHVEHVAPQKLTTSWSDALGCSGSDYKTLVDDIGNLTLLDSGLNQSVKQADFDQKVHEYKRSTLAISRDLTHVHEWSRSTIEQRKQWIIESIQILLEVESSGNVVEFSKWLKNND